MESKFINTETVSYMQSKNMATVDQRIDQTQSDLLTLLNLAKQQWEVTRDAFTETNRSLKNLADRFDIYETQVKQELVELAARLNRQLADNAHLRNEIVTMKTRIKTTLSCVAILAALVVGLGVVWLVK